jgi:hypothetical protein
MGESAMAQRTWLSFTDFATANSKLSGYTYAALNVIEENLPVREQVRFIATAEVTDMFGDVYDGVLVLTDSSIYIGHADNTTNQAYASHTSCNDENALDRLRDRGDKAVYRTNGFSGQSIAISIDSANQLEPLLFGTSRPRPTPQSAPEASPPAPSDPGEVRLVVGCLVIVAIALILFLWYVFS